MTPQRDTRIRDHLLSFLNAIIYLPDINDGACKYTRPSYTFFSPYLVHEFNDNDAVCKLTRSENIELKMMNSMVTFSSVDL